MEDARLYPRKEYGFQAHKLETPLPLMQILRVSAEKIGDSEGKELTSNLIDFKQNVFNFMTHFNLDMEDFKSDMVDKRFERGGFTKRAVQKHPFLGVRGYRLVRDKLSDGVFLKDSEKDLYNKLLERKLLEEVVELTEAMSRRERIEELGDVFEVFDTLLDVKRIDKRLMEEKRKEAELKAIKERRKLARKK
jgi:predicted house-cleaning noncanonical NTP pyrophosphatase (MazG superfamily)